MPFGYMLFGIIKILLSNLNFDTYSLKKHSSSEALSFFPKKFIYKEKCGTVTEREKD